MAMTVANMCVNQKCTLGYSILFQRKVQSLFYICSQALYAVAYNLHPYLGTRGTESEMSWEVNKKPQCFSIHYGE